MTAFAATFIATGERVEYEADAPHAEHLGAGWHLEEIVSVPQPADVGEVPPPPREWTPIDFLRRFTPAERILARAARKTDPILDDFYALLEQAPTIRSLDPAVAMGLGYMTQQGYLAVGRASEILNG